MRVVIKYPGIIQTTLGVSEETINLYKETPLEQLLQILVERHPQIKEKLFPATSRRYILFIVNGRLRDETYVLNDDDTVCLIQPVAGG